MDNLETTVKKSKIPRFARNTVLALEVAAGIFLGTLGYTQKADAQHTLTVQANNQQGNPLPGAQVILQTPSGTLKGTTNGTGIATFEDVSGASTVTMAGASYIGASQSIAIDASKTFNGVIIDGAGITAQILKNTNSVDPIYVKNPILFDITSPDPVIPVDASDFGTADSTTIMGYAAQVNALWGSAVYVPGKVEAYTDRGITLKRTSGPFYRTTHTLQGENLWNSTCFLKSDLLYYFVDYELFAHAICQFGDPTPPATVGYSPSIFNSDHISPNATVTNNAPSQSSITNPINGDNTVDARAAMTSTWTPSTDADGDWVRYKMHLQSTSDASLDTVIKNINSTMRTLPVGTLKDNTTYSINIISTDNDLETQSSTITFTTASHTTPNNPPVIVSYIADQTMQTETSRKISLEGRVTDADNDPITKTATGPSELNIAIVQDTLRMFAQAGYFGNGNIIVTYDDNKGGIAKDTFEVNVPHIQPNSPPTPFAVVQPINGDTATYVGRKIIFQYERSTDADNDTVKYIIQLTGPGIDPKKPIAVTTTDTTFSLDDSLFQKGSHYTGTAKATDGKDTTEATNIFDWNTPTTDVKIDGIHIPKGWMLYQNYPNPFNPTTTICYNLVKVGNLDKVNITVSLRVYDVLGREIGVLVNEEKPAGEYRVEFNASHLPSGVYFYRFSAGNYTATKKLVLMK